MRTLGQILSFLIAALAIPLFTIMACNLALMPVLISPGTYRTVLEDEAVFEELIPVALPAILAEVEEDNVSVTTDNINLIELIEVTDAETLRAVSDLLIPPEWLQSQTQILVNAYQGLLEGDYTSLDQPLALNALRNRFIAEANNAAEIIILNAPDCTRTQIDQLETLQNTNEGTLPICNPPAEFVDSSMTDVALAIRNSARSLGNQPITIRELFGIDETTSILLTSLISIVLNSLWYAFLCPIALVSLVVTFAVRSRREFGLWVGGIGVLSAIGTFILLVAFQLIVVESVERLLAANTAVEAFTTRITSSVLQAAFIGANTSFIVIALIYLVLGIILLGIGWVSPATSNQGPGYVLMTSDGRIIETVAAPRSTSEDQATVIVTKNDG